ncbi:hypothetical protein ADN00_16460 [Ornatilinea apprima]|uniref:Uncharacterized protein n=1 Tax=Ornatilinea apprima TaxID=1134406 RepID=A0A0P6XR47_9CHLR|nr:hypothetical protein [Ornatilinea apprima]KPL72067.1 hypothetical protein ADN00_16460 [Ornatilinea apprima]
MNELIEVTYTSDAGSILPELQWHEEIIVNEDAVTFLRNGKTPDTKVNAGTWNVQTDEKTLQALFSALKNVDCANIKRIEPTDPPDGGGTETYILRFADETTCSLYFDPGTSYENGDFVVKPVQNFMQALAFPPEALNRYID